jgi:hypothetical protein
MSNVQPDWRWCHKCQGLFFAGNPSKGVCPADANAHDASQSGKYDVIFGETVAPRPAGPDTFGDLGQQGDWRWCSNCQGLFFAGHNTHGVCPAQPNKGPHITLEADTMPLRLPDSQAGGGATSAKASSLQTIQAREYALRTIRPTTEARAALMAWVSRWSRLTSGL